MFHPDGVVGVERTKPLKQVSAAIVGLSPSSLCPHLQASSAGSRRRGWKSWLGEVHEPGILPRHRSYLLVPQFLLHRGVVVVVVVLLILAEVGGVNL